MAEPESPEASSFLATNENGQHHYTQPSDSIDTPLDNHVQTEKTAETVPEINGELSKSIDNTIEAEAKRRKLNNDAQNGEIAQNSIIATEVGAGEPVPAGVDQPQMLGYPQFIHFNPHMMQQFMGQQGPVSSAAGGQEKEDAGHAGQSPFAFNPGFSNPVFAQAMGFHMMQAAANMSRYPHPGSTGANVPHGNDPRLTGRPPICLYMTCDNDSLSEYQCLVRKQIQLFEATPEDADTNAQGRNKPIQAGQLGICCRHCCFLPPKHRSRGAVYYPAKLDGLYQAAQNMAGSHFSEHCRHMPQMIRDELLKLKERKSSAGGGKKYWADAVRVLGVTETEEGLRFTKSMQDPI